MGSRARNQMPKRTDALGKQAEDFAITHPPQDFPPRQPTIPPAKITVAVKNTIDVGHSMKESIRCRMESGKFTAYLLYPPELDTVKKKKSRRKGGIKDINKRLDELNKLEDQNADDSDHEGGGGSKASSDEEEAKDSDNSQASDSDEEMDEGNDYNQMHDVDDDEDMGAPSDDDDGEGIE